MQKKKREGLRDKDGEKRRVVKRSDERKYQRREKTKNEMKRI